MGTAFTLISPESPAILLKRVEDSVEVKLKRRDRLTDNANRLIDKRSRWLSERLKGPQSRPYYRGFVTDDGFELIRIPSWLERGMRVYATGKIELNHKGESVIRVACRFPFLTKIIMGFVVLFCFVFGATVWNASAGGFFIGWGFFMAFIFFLGRLAEEKDLEWKLREILHAKSIS
jgi:hypothetical protein